MAATDTPGIRFGPYMLDAPNARLLCEGRSLTLTPKAFDVLHYLASRPDRLVTKNELLSAVWRDVIVSDASIKVCVGEIRKALGDGAKTPRYIETVHRRGYRFIALAAVGGPAVGAPEPPAKEAAAPSSVPRSAAPQPSRHSLVGREVEFQRLVEAFTHADAGQRQCVFVTGSAGGGKTALVETFARYIQSAHESGQAPLVLVGHCFEQFGAAEPYLPAWEALGQAARERSVPALAALLERRTAAYGPGGGPTTPGPAGRAGAMSERLLREMADAIEALAAAEPVVLLLEDVHWADYSTLDLLSALARRQAPARLMVLATCRSTATVAARDMGGGGGGEPHPLRAVMQSLLTAALAREVRLEFLDEWAVARFLARRFPGSPLPAVLARRLHQRTEGHPLFLVHLIDDLIEQGALVERAGTWQLAGDSGAPAANTPDSARAAPAGWLAVLETQVPRSVRAMIELQLERLSAPERQALEAAAVTGMEFSAAAVAAGLGVPGDVVAAEQVCDGLARRHHLLRPSGLAEWPDGTVASCYRFVHQLHQGVVYEEIPAARRVRLHQVLGERLATAWGDRAGEEAAQLAMHFELGRDWSRAVTSLRLAARAAGRQYAHREAVGYLRRALAAVDRLPAGAPGTEHELDLLMGLGVNLQVTAGCAAPEIEAIYARAHALCQSGEGGDPRRTFPVRWGIWVFHKVRSNLAAAAEMARELLAIARRLDDPVLLLQAHQAMSVTALCLGSPAEVCAHMEQAVARYDPVRHPANTERFGQDPGAATLAFGSVALWLMGRAGEALNASGRAVDLARQSRQPTTQALTLYFAAMLHQLRGDAAATARWAQDTIALAGDEGFSFWLAGGLVFRGWAQVAGGGDEADAAGGLAEIHRGIDAWLATGSRTYHTYHLGLLADALLRLGRVDEASKRVDEALAAATALSEGLFEAELHRLKGRCVLRSSPAPADLSDARACFGQAVAVARRQGAAWFEGQAAADLAGLPSPTPRARPEPPSRRRPQPSRLD